MSEQITKTYDASLEVNEGKREVLAIISSDSIDRDGEVVSPKGLKKKNFAGNPVVMVNHDYQSLPIGKALWVKQDGNRILAKYYVTDKTELGRDVFGLLQDGVLNAHSIGFISNHSSKPTTQEKNLRPELANAKLIHRDWELMEFSVVGIPANPDATALAVSKGISNDTLVFLGIIKGSEGETIVETIQESLTAEQIRAAFYQTLYGRLKR